ncbi:hypothetical protein [Micromonospora maris]|uniref:Uncharacterized protein n=1 Tax=Micromonospora maris TaxID=1003110 RepID=A0A9X0HZM4_9ACTN|nr:hypothetical protein [Micromonospora maris]AEB44554.1 hypothetical protein VAB18032_17260 [Micromonospora maris AB-18-032]KUJ44062.1 hypothetical protein ADL17_12520 [Micromonospora maris]
MITVYDTGLVTSAPVDAGIRGMLDDLHGRWPNMVVALDRKRVGPILPWRNTRTRLIDALKQALISQEHR